jgi:hypothetical protein
MEINMNETIEHIVMQRYKDIHRNRQFAFMEVERLQEDLARAIKGLKNIDTVLDAIQVEMMPPIPKMGTMMPGIM